MTKDQIEIIFIIWCLCDAIALLLAELKLNLLIRLSNLKLSLALLSFVILGPIGLLLVLNYWHKEVSNKLNAGKLPIIGIIFDGSLKSNDSDEAVSGSIASMLLVMKFSQVAIISHRSNSRRGRKYMRSWLKQNLKYWLEYGGKEYHRSITDRMELSGFDPGMEPWSVAIDYWADEVVEKIIWPSTYIKTLLTVSANVVPVYDSWPNADHIEQQLTEIRNHRKRP